jgi:hypothetical protein
VATGLRVGGYYDLYDFEEMAELTSVLWFMALGNVNLNN